MCYGENKYDKNVLYVEHFALNGKDITPKINCNDVHRKNGEKNML